MNITNEMFDAHERWLNDHTAGQRLVLKNTEVSYELLAHRDLSYASLEGCTLKYCTLTGTKLAGADLRGAQILGYQLHDTDFSKANLHGALIYSNILYSCCFVGADLRDADFRNVACIRTNFKGARTKGANFSNASLETAINIPKTLKDSLNIIPQGYVVGYKRCMGRTIVKLLIPPGVRRSNGTTRRCRAESAFVLKVYNETGTINSVYDPSFWYTEGMAVTAKNFSTNRWVECCSGIHFFLTREEAEDYGG